MKKASWISEQAADCQALAERARRLAETLLDGPDKDELLRYAKELETQAAGLKKKERPRASPSRLGPPAHGPERHAHRQRSIVRRVACLGERRELP